MKKVQIDGLGDVTFKKSARAKYIKLKVVPFDGVIVTIPTYLNYEFGINAVMGKYDWLSTQLEKVKSKENSLAFKGTDFPMNTMLYTVQVLKKEIEKPRRAFVNNTVNLFLPINSDINDIDIQLFLSDSINKVYRAEAKLYLPERIYLFAKQFSLDVGKVTIRNTKTRWGSCSYQNNISLSFHLLKLPKHLIDYVVLHELAHTKEKNHQKPFWNLLDTFCDGKAKQLDKELKNYNFLILR